MLCRLIVTCALLGHVVLSLPAARAPRYSPLPDEVDSDETRRVLGSSVVTSVSVIMDLGNGSQALFSEPSGSLHGGHTNDNSAQPESSIINPLSPEKRPVGSPPALLSPDRYEFYTFDESGELVRRLMTLEQIQSLIAGGDDANRIAAIPLDVEIDTVPSPQASDQQGQVVASVQQVLAEELLASTKKNGTEPHETEVEVEAEVQEVPPPPSSPKPEQEEEELTHVKVSTEAAPEAQQPTVASTTQMSTEVPSSTASVGSDSAQEQDKPDEVPLLSTEIESQGETDFKEETTMPSAENEASSSASPASEEDSVQEAAESDEVKDTQSPIEAVTEKVDMPEETEEHQTSFESSTEKQEEMHENVYSPPTDSTSNSDGMDEVKESASTEATNEEGMESIDDKFTEDAEKPEMEGEEEDKVSEVPAQATGEKEPHFEVTTPSVVSIPQNEEVEDNKPTEEPNQSFAESEEIPNESELSNKNPPLSQTDDQNLSEMKPVDGSTMTTFMETPSEVKPLENSDSVDRETTLSDVASTPSIETSSEKDALDDTMPTGIIVADVDDIPPNFIPSDSHILEEADLSGVSDEVPPSVPTFEDKPEETETSLAENGMAVEESPIVPDLEAVLPEMPVSAEPESEKPAKIPTETEDQESKPATPAQIEGGEGDGDKDEIEEAEDDEESLLDQLADSVSSVLSQVSDLDDDDYDDFRKKPQPAVTPVATTQLPQDAAPTATTELPSAEEAGDEIKHEVEGEESYTYILPDMRDPTKDTSHVIVSAPEDEVMETPADDDVEQDESMVNPSDQPAVGVTMTDETEEEGNSEMEEGDDAVHEVPTVVSGDSVQDAFVPTTTTESHVEVPLTTEGGEPSLTPDESPSTTEESKKDNEPAKEDIASEKESAPTTSSSTDVDRVAIPNLMDLENVQAVVGEEGDNKETETPPSSATTLPEMSIPTTENGLLIERFGETTQTAGDLKPSEEDKSGEEKVEAGSTLADGSSDISDLMTTMPTPTEEDGMKDEKEKEEEETTAEKDDEKKEIEKESGSVEATTQSSIVATTEMHEVSKEEVTQTTVPPTDATDIPTTPDDQSAEDSSLELADAVKDVPEDHVLLENLHKEAEKDSDPLLGGDEHAVEESTDMPTTDYEATTTYDDAESSSAENDDKNGMVKGDVTSPSPLASDHHHPSEEAEESKPSATSTTVEDEVEVTEAPTLEEAVEAQPAKATVVTEIEQPVDSSSPEPSKNPWTSIPIPVRSHVSTTPESNKQPTSHPATPSTADSDSLSYSSASPDDLPDPNGLLPLLAEKPSQTATFKPSDELLSSTTVKPSSTYSPSTTDISTTAESIPAPGGSVVPPLMPAFPQAPQGNVGLEATSASTDPDVKRFVDLCNDLAFALYGQVTSGAAASSVPATRGANGGGVQTRSLVVSPFAITSLLAMVFLGARGPTSEEMNDLLRLDDMITFNPHLVLQNVTDAVITSPGVSAAAFVRELYSDKSNGKLLEFYKARAKAFYDGHVEEVDFKEVNDVIRRRTNHLIRWQTRGRVPEYLRGSSLKLRSPLAALSANFFEADCQRASSTGTDGEMYFEMPATGRRRRRLVPVPAVVWRGVFLAGHDAGLDATVLELRHGGGEVSTVLVLPGRHGQSVEAADVSGGLTRLENWMIKGGRQSWSALLRSALPRGPLEVQLPRFAHRSVINVTGALSRMGLQHLFQDGKADLGGLDGGLGGKLHLADMIQMTAFGVCADDGSSKRHLETYPSAQRTGRKHRRSLPDKFPAELPEESPEDELPEEVAETSREGRSRWMDELAREEDDSYVFAAAAAARELPLALRPRQARIPRPALKQQPSRIVLPRLRFDRPFLYFVRHNPSGFILLMGRFNPRLFP